MKKQIKKISSQKQQYWLVKSENTCYSIDDLRRDTVTSWSGVRNYQARNYMRDDMRVGDLVLFYHSNSKPSGIYGLAQVHTKAHADESQFDPKDEHYDPKSSVLHPIWSCVDIAFVQKFDIPITLRELKHNPVFQDMYIARKGDRLSVQPVAQKHFDYILQLAQKEIS